MQPPDVRLSQEVTLQLPDLPKLLSPVPEVTRFARPGLGGGSLGLFFSFFLLVRKSGPELTSVANLPLFV